MSFWSKPHTTTALLGVIAVLLLVIVVQNATRSRGTSGTESPASPMANPHMANPPMAGAPPMAGENFDPAAMIFAALKCPNDPTLALGDPGCGGKEADSRRDSVRGFLGENLPIRQVFDRIVAKFGEAALTDQALEIRRMRKQSR